MDNHSLHDFIAKTGLALLVITIYFQMAASNRGLAYPEKPSKHQTNKVIQRARPRQHWPTAHP